MGGESDARKVALHGAGPASGRPRSVTYLGEGTVDLSRRRSPRVLPDTLSTRG